MFDGEREHVKIRALNTLLDTFIDRFGTRDAKYMKDDNNHFIATLHVAVSGQFFGWLCGLGNRVKIVSPNHVSEEFKKYLDKIYGLYE